ncbi:MAG TPA: hypothetical protein VJS92_03345 [Candidatus Polarisedimenticolaceae bacterium]|nr:hypothetical protein [Candidatus Polarisedimenticolaceae bacterium]
MDTEKITINLAPVDLGKIDLLVSQGVYASRSDLIRAGLRRELDQHDEMVKDTVTRDSFVIGVLTYNRALLERMRQQGKRLSTRVVGVLHLSADVTPELADEVFEHIAVRGVFRGPRAVLDRLAPKTDRRLSREA